MLETLGHYRILDRIGAGGMGEVYRARDTRLGRTVAIKVLASGVASDLERRELFLREARATGLLSHPNIAALYEIGEDQGLLYLVFEFVPGETLRTTSAGRPLNPRRALDFAIQIADALADAHAEGIVHRDIKPDNIIVTPKGNAKILDFGLAAWTSGGAEREQAARAVKMMAGGGTMLSTVAYMSPEQALGEQVDARTDIFSLGIVLFEMLTGRLPFTATTSTELALQIVKAPPPVPSSVNPQVPKELNAIVRKALTKSMDRRYEAAATLAAELRAVAAILDVRSATIEPPNMAETMAPRRSYAGWIALVLVLAALAALAWWQRQSIERVLRGSMGPPPAPTIAVIPLEPAGSSPTSAENFREPLGERRPRQHLVDAGLARGVDDVGLHVRGEPEGGNRRERRVLLHDHHGADRIGPGVVEIEDHERRGAPAHVGQRGVRRPREGHGHAELTRRILDLGREHQIIEDC